jgi:parafibromin
MDALFVIRDAHTSGYPIRDNGEGFYLVGNKRLEWKSETCFKKALKSGGYYTVHDVVFFLQNAELAMVDYRKAALAAKAAGVTQVDRSKLNDYLNAVVDTVDSIDMAKQKEQRKAASAAGGGAGSGDVEVGDGASPGVDEDAASDARLDELRKVSLDLRRLVDASEEPSEELRRQFMEADKAYLTYMRADNVPAMTRTTVMERPKSDFGFALDLFKRVLRDRNSGVRGDVGTGSGGAGSSSSGAGNKRPHASISGAGTAAAAPGFSKKSKGLPIIIVPNSMTTLISGLNVRDFLEKGQYVPVAQKKEDGAKRQPSQVLKIQLVPGAGPTDVTVTDNPASIKKEDWDRVIAVFVVGQEWQFKPMLWKTPVELFQNVLGVHIAMDTANTATQPVGRWQCTIQKISASRRHMDAVAVDMILKAIYNHTRVARPWLL